MARYIDAEKLIEHLKDNIEECETPNVVNEPVAYGTVLGLECALSYAETLPTADVVEVKHGEWIYHECVSSYDGAISGYSCSECSAFVDEEMFDSDEFHKDYCGCCGAKMDGKKEITNEKNVK